MEEDSDWIDQLLDHTRWQTKRRYQNLTRPMHGAFGLVCFADDQETSEKVAIKKIARPFDSKRLAQLAYRELHMLKRLSHENILKLIDTFTPAKTAEEMDSLYLVTNCMETTLHAILQLQKLDHEQIQLLTYQLIRGLKYLHSCDILHRDLKPTNIIVNAECELQIIDFGLAKSQQTDNTPYVVTRWYRAPEVIIQRHYNKAVDIWSVGCILAEMYLNRPLFPGASQYDQLNRIMAVVGFPSDEMMNDLMDEMQGYLANINPKPVRVNFVQFFANITDQFGNRLEMDKNLMDAIDLIDKMLVLDPSKRISCEEALEHTFLAKYHDEKDEPIGDKYIDQYENEELNVSQWKTLIFNEIQSFVPPK